MKVFRTLHDEFRHGPASTPAKRDLAPTGARLVSLAFPLFRSALATTHSVLFAADSDFFFWYGGGGRGRVSPKRETDGILVPIRRTRFCQTIFWGYGFGKTETDLILYFVRAEEGSGEESARASVLEFSV